MAKASRSTVFQFKEFQVEQKNCNMKINTDSVLMGSLSGRNLAIQSSSSENLQILDIGTGTGVIALMLAQRFPSSKISALEIDQIACQLATDNFLNSPFSHQLILHELSFQEFSKINLAKFDLIVSNPPYFLNSLPNPDERKKMSRHTDASFFSELLNFAKLHLKAQGLMQLIVPADIFNFLKENNDFQQHFEFLDKIDVYSFEEDSQPVRMILTLGKKRQIETDMKVENFVIYSGKGTYSKQYQEILKPFLLKL